MSDGRSGGDLDVSAVVLLGMPDNQENHEERDDVGQEDRFADADGDVHGSGTAPSARSEAVTPAGTISLQR